MQHEEYGLVCQKDNASTSDSASGWCDKWMVQGPVVELEETSESGICKGVDVLDSLKYDRG